MIVLFPRLSRALATNARLRADTCVRPTPAQCHCATCHKTYGGITGFDAHRRNGVCVEPKGYVEIKGIWRQPAPDRPFWEAS